MLLRSGKLTTNECTTRRRNSEMANQPNNGEIPPSITAETTVIPTVSETIPSTVGSAPTLTVTQTGPILSYVGPRGPLGTPPPRVNPGSRPYVPPGFSTSWMG